MQKPVTTVKERCGLCGKTRNLVKTGCCGNWICNDQHKYVLFSYARNSCARNHDRYTVCGFHYHEKHPGDWKDCSECRESFKTEIYVWYGTNEYNFEKLDNPPAYEPTKCSDCEKIIRLGTDGYCVLGSDVWCMRCHEKRMKKEIRKRLAENSEKSDSHPK